MIQDKARFEAAIRRFDALNAEDPHVELENGVPVPKEVLYARRMTECLNRVAPEASEALQLAARCQHIRRWTIARQDFPMDTQGYNKWRNTLKKLHGDIAGQVLTECGYESGLTERVRFLVEKRQLKIDPEVQLLEDVVCLVFLQYYFQDFAAQHPEEKVIDIVRKTWRKMTPQGQQLALQLDLPEQAKTLVGKALS